MSIDRVHIQRTRDGSIDPGTWYVSTGEGPCKGELWHKCPQCKKASVMVNHSVAPDGVVSPSIACFSPCTYHVWGTLDGWTFGEKKSGGLVST